MLPDIEIGNLEADEVILLYDWIRSIASPPATAILYSIRDDENYPLLTFDRPVERLFAGEIEPFHHLLGPIMADGVQLPALAIYIGDEDGILFDYRVGSEWTEETLFAFVKFLCVIASKTRAPEIYDSGLIDTRSSSPRQGRVPLIERQEFAEMCRHFNDRTVSVRGAS